ncbi:hypothetical protein F5144DRAFT_496984, partial [Chaetomium tenue]
ATKTAFLKLYDPRSSDSLRCGNGIDPWEPTMEIAYIKAIQAGANTIRQLLDDVRHIENLLHDTYHANEVAAYYTLRNFQGEVIPRLLEDVNLNLKPPNTPDDELFYVKGILLSHVDGFCLEQLADHAPRGAWQDIVFMVDFGQCRFKAEDESKQDFGKAKAAEDEEGNVGIIMRYVLKSQHDFQLQYTPSRRYDKWKDDDDG